MPMLVKIQHWNQAFAVGVDGFYQFRSHTGPRVPHGWMPSVNFFSTTGFSANLLRCWFGSWKKGVVFFSPPKWCEFPVILETIFGRENIWGSGLATCRWPKLRHPRVPEKVGATNAKHAEIEGVGAKQDWFAGCWPFERVQYSQTSVFSVPTGRNWNHSPDD